MLRRTPKGSDQVNRKSIMNPEFTLEELLLLRRAVNALKTRQELNLLSCTDNTNDAIKHTIERLESVDQKLLSIKPVSRS